MNISQVGEVVEMLQQSFAQVFVQASVEPVVIGRDHNRMPAVLPCKHVRVIRATDVTVCIRDGFLTSGETVPIASVDFCQRCEKVLALVRVEDLRKPRVIKKPPVLAEPYAGDQRQGDRRVFQPEHPNLAAAISPRRMTTRRES